MEIKLTKDIFIEGQIIEAGTVVRIGENQAEDRAIARNDIQKWVSEGLTYMEIHKKVLNMMNSRYMNISNDRITAYWDALKQAFPS